MLSIFLALVALVIIVWNFDIAESTIQAESTFLSRRFPHQSWRRVRHNIDEIFYCWFIFASIMSPSLLLEPANFWIEKGIWRNPEGVLLITFFAIAIISSIIYLACLIDQAANEVKHEINDSESKGRRDSARAIPQH